MNPLKPYTLLIVISCALTGYFIAFCKLNNHLIQYPSLRSGTLNVKVRNGVGKDSVVVLYPVTRTQTAADSLHTPVVVASNPTEKVHTRQLLFHTNPNLMIWFMLVLLMITIASGAAPVFAGNAIAIFQRFKNWKGHWLVSLLGTVLIVLLLMTTLQLNGYYKPQDVIHDLGIIVTDSSIITGIVTVTILLTVPIIFTMFLVTPASYLATKNLSTKDDVEKAARDLEYLNKLLLSALQFLSVIVVFSILTSSALRLSIKATIDTGLGYDIFPDYASYVYGLYFSLFLGIIYIPTYYYLKLQTDTFKQSVRTVGGTDNDWKQSVLGVVKVDNSALDNMRLAFTVLSPLLSSFLPEVLQVFK